MRTPAQIEASRRNGAKSRGPITPEGKARSAANSAHSTGPRTPEGKARSAANDKSHLLANGIVIPDESSEEFLELLANFRQAHEPVGFLEERVVEKIAVNDWRLRRTWFVLTGDLAHATLEQEHAADPLVDAHNAELAVVRTSIATRNLCNNGRSLEQHRRAEAQYSREYRYACAELEKLQAKRREKEKFEPELNLSTDPDDFIDPMDYAENESAPEPNPTPQPTPNPVTPAILSPVGFSSTKSHLPPHPINPTDTQHQPEAR
jgi:hypothetical protein